MTEYDSYSNYESSVLKAKASQSSFSFGIKIPGVFELGYNSNDNRFKKFIQRMKRFSSTVSTAPLNSLLTRYMYVCVYQFDPHHQPWSAAMPRINEIFPPDWILQFALVRCILRPQSLRLFVQHPRTFLFTCWPETRLPSLQNQPQLSALCPVSCWVSASGFL